jgi:hypothetical protein
MLSKKEKEFEKLSKEALSCRSVFCIKKEKHQLSGKEA